MSQTLDCLAVVLQTPGALPALLWGDFGTGKTSCTLAMADALGWDVELLRPGERGEGALGVVPVPRQDGTVLHYPLPDWAARLRDSDRPGLVFLDEISSTAPALQPAIMGLALDGMIAGQRLPARVRRVAAANPTDQAGGGWDLAPALANRFVHLDWPSPSAGEWCAWLMGGNESALPVRLDLDAWAREWPAAKALGAAYIRAHPGSLHEDPAKATGRTPPAFATPRTWESALRLLASCRAADRDDLYPQLAQGCLGPTWEAWAVWLREMDLPDPEKVLQDPTLFSHDPRRPDRTFATLLAVAEAALATNNGKPLTAAQRGERWNLAFPVVQRALDQKAGKDIALLPVRVLCQRQEAGGRRPKVTPTDLARKVCAELIPFLDLTKEK
jgi:MoxR-like ATPase